MSVRIPRAIRAQRQKAFPAIVPDVAQLNFAELAAWRDQCQQQRFLTSAWTLSGLRWRRAAARTSREYRNRLLAHRSATPGLCDACHTQPVTTHVAYQPEAAPRFAHYCGACAPRMPPGWMCVVVFGTPPNGSPAR